MIHCCMPHLLPPESAYIRSTWAAVSSKSRAHLIVCPSHKALHDLSPPKPREHLHSHSATMTALSFKAMRSAWLCTCLALAILSACAAQSDPVPYHSNLYNEWRTSRPHVFWAEGPGQRMGQVCDVWRTPATSVWPAVDAWEGCATLFLAEPNGNFTVKDLPANQQNNFQNTQKYNMAWAFDKPLGLKEDALPIAGTDMNAVCYLFNLDGRLQMGYEEGDGDSIVPCNPDQGSFAFNSTNLLTATPQQLQTYCDMCYQSVCSSSYSRDPRSCGSGYQVGTANTGNVLLNLTGQATPAYHCHLTMSNEGACDYVQYKQHETARQYYMPSAVVCGWQSLKQFKVTECDCTRVAGTDNGCGALECYRMAAQGFACANCNSCSSSDSREYIFGLYNKNSYSSDARYHGSCGLARYLRETEYNTAAHKQAERLCAEAILCPQPALNSTAAINLTQSSCALYCQLTNTVYEMAMDTRCPAPPAPAGGARRLLQVELASSSYYEGASVGELPTSVLSVTEQMENGHLISRK
eukprot:jgi/Mesvir1/6122/Mv00827-RA.1